MVEELELELINGGRCESVGDVCFELDFVFWASTVTSRDPQTCQSSYEVCAVVLQLVLDVLRAEVAKRAILLSGGLWCHVVPGISSSRLMSHAANSNGSPSSGYAASLIVQCKVDVC